MGFRERNSPHGLRCFGKLASCCRAGLRFEQIKERREVGGRYSRVELEG
jgi:hypothetical protein